MSFDHTQPHKPNSSCDREPVAELPQHNDSDCSDASLIEASGLRASAAVDDDEARFELLSAYLDDEVTAEERQLVAQWLMDDSNTQQMYQRLLMLRQAIRTAPVPAQPPLQTPSPLPQPWEILLSQKFYQTLVCAIAIALLGSLSQLSTSTGRQQLQEAWQYIKALPQGTLFELALTVRDLSDNSTK